MASLKFIVGPVASGKTIDLIITAHQLQKIQGVNSVKILKPTIDTRFSANVVRSAAGLEIKVTHLINPIQDILSLDYSLAKYVIVDEIQFFTVKQIEQLREVSIQHDIEVMCYGLLNDFRLNMFESSKRLLEICDEFHQITNFCLLCKEHKNEKIGKGTHNLRIKTEGSTFRPVIDGDSVFIGGIDSFIPVCFACYDRCTSNLRKVLEE